MMTSERQDEDLFTVGVLEEGGLAALASQGDLGPASKVKASNAGKEKRILLLRLAVDFIKTRSPVLHSYEFIAD